SCAVLSYADHPQLPPFPTRRSSDLLIASGSNAGRPDSARIAVMKAASGAPFIALDDPTLRMPAVSISHAAGCGVGAACDPRWRLDRKSTRLNSSHVKISYAVFCLKK